MFFRVQRPPTPEESHLAVALLAPTFLGAYRLGFLWADGHLYERACRVEMEILSTDAAALGDVFPAEQGWAVKHRHRHGRKPQTTFSIVNQPFRCFLQGMGYGVREEGANKILEHLPPHLHPYWWRGYLDGDGHIDVRRCHLIFCSCYNQEWGFMETLSPGAEVARRVTKQGFRYSHHRTSSIPRVQKALRGVAQNIGLPRKEMLIQEMLERKKKHRRSAGSLNPSATINWAVVQQIRELRASKNTYSQIAHVCGLSISQVGRICRNESWVGTPKTSWASGS